MARRLALALALVGTALVPALTSARGSAATGPLWTDPANTVSGEACCADEGGPYAIGSADIQNRGNHPLTIRRIVIVWERRPGLGHPRQFAQFMVGGDKHGDFGDGYSWPPRPQEIEGKRRRIPGARLAPNETGQVILGINLPHRRTLHMQAIVVHYTYAGHAYELRTRSEMWYCYTSQSECDRLAGRPFPRD